MLTNLTSFANIGLHSERITVEIGATPGEGMITIVGLGDTAVQESKSRVRLALRASGYRLPTGKSIVINLAPADVRKVGPRYDLAVALGLLMVNELVTLPDDVTNNTAFLGELALDGTLRHVSGVLPAALACREKGIKTLVVPFMNGPEAALVPGIDVIAPKTLPELIAVLSGTKKPTPIEAPELKNAPSILVDFADIRGQDLAKRALEIAAAGGHNVLLSGAPGSGKTLLAQALRGILPPLSREESLEVTRIYSVANLLPADQPLIMHRPFRLIHHTASGISIVGGGQIPGPGEISLAHKGVLFLDELAEFPMQVLEVLRQPLEDRKITITRAQGSVTFPADVLLIGAMNPPQYATGGKSRMQRRISAPFLDRMDLTIDVQPVPIEDLGQKPRTTGETSRMILDRVVRARERQIVRFKHLPISTNKEMGVREIRDFCAMDSASETLLKQAAERLNLSARTYHRTIKVARTIADLAGCHAIEAAHIAEALQYRQNLGFE
ncbi:YifB family Mg chelatase-like AAA ATPase [Candidatus Peribacteria bacterium]|nr:MAG: YifB family Mg chelatase-like AAA ATPase [Candidatus Peribacteria bacterium]